jgi:hypothetical protein
MKNEQIQGNLPTSYERPMLIAIGNLRDVVAATTKNFDCDGPVNSGAGDHSGDCGD